jgi:hypothetical protein
LRDAAASETIGPMRRVPVLTVLVFCLLAPAAHADGLDTLQRLAKRHLSPAPLVPTAAPRPLSNLEVALTTSPVRGKRGYGLRLEHYTDSGPDAIIVLERGSFSSVRAAVRDYHRRGGYRVKRTRLRGRRAFVLTRKLDGGRSTVVVWREDKSVYSIGSGTPKKVSLRGLRATAKGLDQLGANYIGTYVVPSTNTSFDAVLVTTQHFVTGIVDWGTDNCTFNGFPAAAHGGEARFTMLPLRSGAFSIPLHGPAVSPAGWNGTISGAASASAVNLTIQGSGTFDDTACDTGAMSVSAPRRDPI